MQQATMFWQCSRTMHIDDDIQSISKKLKHEKCNIIHNVHFICKFSTNTYLCTYPRDSYKATYLLLNWFVLKFSHFLLLFFPLFCGQK